ncbi:MAG: hypothetical protein AB7K09_23785 [Planctomycetota bacterium]
MTATAWQNHAHAMFSRLSAADQQRVAELIEAVGGDAGFCADVAARGSQPIPTDSGRVARADCGGSVPGRAVDRQLPVVHLLREPK